MEKVNLKIILNCTEHFVNEEINKKLYKYFDSFTYELYDNNKNNTYDSDNNDLNSKISDIRYLSETENSGNTYYGMKKITHIKQLYKYNLIGIKMQGHIYSEINPSNGRMDVYAVIGFGNLNTKIKIKEQISNYHIILDRSNQMGYNLLLLINQTNNELIQRNKKYSEIILEFEKNFTHFFEKYCDYSNLFNESLNNMYNQVQNFSGEFFHQLIDLINRVYNNYSIILEDVKLGEYDFINKIRNITKDEYIKYIYNQLETLEIFENKTLLFLDNLENELYNIKDFQVDVLYDIIDSISDSKQIFKKFNKNLFESIEKGILKFKCDINDHIDNIIGEFLFITEFLSVNINKNEIFIRAIDEETRKEVTIKLKNFRIMVNSIIDLLNSNINDN